MGNVYGRREELLMGDGSDKAARAHGSGSESLRGRGSADGEPS